MVEISGVHVKLTGDASGLKGALDDAQDELKETKKDAEQTTQSLRGMAKGLGALAAAAVGIGGIGALFRNVAREAETFETSMFKINAIIRATGGVAGKTGDDLLAFAKSLALNTLESTEGVLEAQQRLLTFRKVSGDVFDRAIRASADLSAAMGTNLSSSAIMLGRALEDPERGLTALTRTGTVFTEAQKEMVQQLVEAGELQKAQTLILKELEAQYGGTAEAAAKGYAGALDTLAQRQQEFLLAINETLGVTDILSAAVNGLASVLNVLAENMQRVVSYIAAAAVGGMIAFRGAILSAGAAIMRVLIPSLTGLRVALIKTGIGALVVALGEAIYQISRLWGWFTQLKAAAGGFGEALTIVRGVFREVFDRMGDGVTGLKNAFLSLGFSMKARWQDALIFMTEKFAKFLRNVSSAMFKVGLEGLGNDLAMEAATLGQSIDGLKNVQKSLKDAARLYGEKSTQSFREMAAPLQSLADIQDLIDEAKEESDTLPVIPGDTGADAPSGGGKGTDYQPQLQALRDYFKTREEILIEEYAKERAMLRDAFLAGQIADQKEFQELSLASAARYQERMAALEREKGQQRLQDAEGVFGALAQVASKSGKGMAKAAATFGGIEAVINAYRAATQALADPSKVTPAQKFAAYASVLAAGLGAVQAIKSAGSKVGAGGTSGGAAATTAPASAPLDVRVAGLGASDLISGAALSDLFDRLQDEAGDRGFTVSFAT